MADKNIRVTVFLTEKIDDQLMDIAEMMGLSKHEAIRYAIATFIGSWKTGMLMVNNSTRMLEEEFSLEKNLEK